MGGRWGIVVHHWPIDYTIGSAIWPTSNHSNIPFFPFYTEIWQTASFLEKLTMPRVTQTTRIKPFGGFPGWSQAKLKAFDFTGATLSVATEEFNQFGWADKMLPNWKRDHPYLAGSVTDRQQQGGWYGVVIDGVSYKYSLRQVVERVGSDSKVFPRVDGQQLNQMSDTDTDESQSESSSSEEDDVTNYVTRKGKGPAPKKVAKTRKSSRNQSPAKAATPARQSSRKRGNPESTSDESAATSSQPKQARLCICLVWPARTWKSCSCITP